MEEEMKLLVVALALLSVQQVQAKNFELYGERGAYDLNAPIVESRAALSDAVAGQIVYDNSTGAFYGLPIGYSPTTASNWLPLSPVVGTTSVVSGATMRIESGRVNCDAGSNTSSESSDWISGNPSNINGAGQCTVTFNSVFSATPHCVVSDVGGTTPVIVSGNPSGATSMTLDCVHENGTICAGYDASIICTGTPN
jgi:hypothetical protein